MIIVLEKWAREDLLVVELSVGLIALLLIVVSCLILDLRMTVGEQRLEVHD